FFSSRRRHTRFSRDWSSDVCSSDLESIARTFEAWQYAVDFPPEILAVIKFSQMRDLVRNHVIDDVRLEVYQAPVKHDVAVAAAEIGRASCREGGVVWGDAGGG